MTGDDDAKKEEKPTEVKAETTVAAKAPPPPPPPGKGPVIKANEPPKAKAEATATVAPRSDFLAEIQAGKKLKEVKAQDDKPAPAKPAGVAKALGTSEGVNKMLAASAEKKKEENDDFEQDWDESADAPVVQPIVATKPAVVEPLAAKPAVAQPVAAKPAVVEPAAAKPAVVEPAAAKPAVVEPAAAKPATPVAAEPAVAKPAASVALPPATNDLEEIKAKAMQERRAAIKDDEDDEQEDVWDPDADEAATATPTTSVGAPPPPPRNVTDEEVQQNVARIKAENEAKRQASILAAEEAAAGRPAPPPPERTEPQKPPPVPPRDVPEEGSKAGVSPEPVTPKKRSVLFSEDPNDVPSERGDVTKVVHKIEAENKLKRRGAYPQNLKDDSSVNVENLPIGVYGKEGNVDREREATTRRGAGRVMSVDPSVANLQNPNAPYAKDVSFDESRVKDLERRIGASKPTKEIEQMMQDAASYLESEAGLQNPHISEILGAPGDNMNDTPRVVNITRNQEEGYDVNLTLGIDAELSPLKFQLSQDELESLAKAQKAALSPAEPQEPSPVSPRGVPEEGSTQKLQEMQSLVDAKLSTVSGLGYKSSFKETGTENNPGMQIRISTGNTETNPESRHYFQAIEATLKELGINYKEAGGLPSFFIVKAEDNKEFFNTPDFSSKFENALAKNISANAPTISYKNKETFLNLTKVNEIPEKDLFVSESNHAFDVIELVESFEKGHLGNPYTYAAFSKKDLESLAEHPEIAQALTSFMDKNASYFDGISEKTLSEIQHFSQNVGLKNTDEQRTMALFRFKEYYDSLPSEEKNALNNSPAMQEQFKIYSIKADGFDGLFKLPVDSCLGGTAGVCEYLSQYIETTKTIRELPNISENAAAEARTESQEPSPVSATQSAAAEADSALGLSEDDYEYPPRAVQPAEPPPAQATTSRTVTSGDVKNAIQESFRLLPEAYKDELHVEFSRARAQFEYSTANEKVNNMEAAVKLVGIAAELVELASKKSKFSDLPSEKRNQIVEGLKECYQSVGKPPAPREPQIETPRTPAAEPVEMEVTQLEAPAPAKVQRVRQGKVVPSTQEGGPKPAPVAAEATREAAPPLKPETVSPPTLPATALPATPAPAAALEAAPEEAAAEKEAEEKDAFDRMKDSLDSQLKDFPQVKNDAGEALGEQIMALFAIAATLVKGTAEISIDTVLNKEKSAELKALHKEREGIQTRVDELRNSLNDAKPGSEQETILRQTLETTRAELNQTDQKITRAATEMHQAVRENLKTQVQNAGKDASELDKPREFKAVPPVPAREIGAPSLLSFEERVAKQREASAAKIQATSKQSPPQPPPRTSTLSTGTSSAQPIASSSAPPKELPALPAGAIEKAQKAWNDIMAKLSEKDKVSALPHQQNIRADNPALTGPVIQRLITLAKKENISIEDVHDVVQHIMPAIVASASAAATTPRPSTPPPALPSHIIKDAQQAWNEIINKLPEGDRARILPKIGQMGNVLRAENPDLKGSAVQNLINLSKQDNVSLADVNRVLQELMPGPRPASPTISRPRAATMPTATTPVVAPEAAEPKSMRERIVNTVTSLLGIKSEKPARRASTPPVQNTAQATPAQAAPSQSTQASSREATPEDPTRAQSATVLTAYAREQGPQTALGGLHMKLTDLQAKIEPKKADYGITNMKYFDKPPETIRGLAAKPTLSLEMKTDVPNVKNFVHLQNDSQGGIEFRASKNAAESTLKNICKLAVDNAPPGTNFAIPASSANAAKVKEYLTAAISELPPEKRDKLSVDNQKVAARTPTPTTPPRQPPTPNLGSGSAAGG